MANQDKVRFPDMESSEGHELPPKKVVAQVDDVQDDDYGDDDGDDVGYASSDASLAPDEQRAAERGWVPLEEWEAAGKDPDAWVDAKTFNKNGELMDVISKQSKKLKKMEKAVEAFKQYHKDVKERAYQEARDKLLEEKADALAMQDTRRAVEIDEELKKVDKEAEVELASEDEVSSNEYKDYFEENWIGKNGWYKKNKGMARAADSFGAEYYSANPDATPEEVFGYVDKMMREEFPEKFSRRSGGSPVEGNSRAGKPSGQAKNVRDRMRDLSEDERKIGKTFVDAGLFKNLEEYVADLVKNGL